MRRFLNNLLRDFRTTSTACGSRQAPRRAMLQVEGLEDRLVMSTVSLLSSPPTTTASQNGSTLSVLVAPSQNTLIQTGRPGYINVYDTGLIGQFKISSINTVVIAGLGNQSELSVVTIDDSKGLPFASGTTVDLNNVYTYLQGSLTLPSSETYVPGSVSTLHVGGRSIIKDTPATLTLHHVGVEFVMNSSVAGGPGTIIDSLPITGALDVQTSGTQVQLGDEGFQYLDGLGNGAGSYFGYSGKPSVTLDMFAPNAGLFLDDSNLPAGESNFTVNMHGAGDTTFVDAPDAAAGASYCTVNMQGAGETTTLDETAKNVTTIVNVDQPATSAIVNLWGNFGPVTVDGDSSTKVKIGFPQPSSGPITSGIEANVTVEGAAILAVDNSANVSTFEQVLVTEHTISGTGLFGNNNVTLTYGGIPTLDIFTGQLADGYTVAPSSPGAVFTSNISIFSDSYWAFHVNVDVYRASHLNLTLVNQQPQKDAGGVLDVATRGVGGSLDFSGGKNGTVDAIFFGRTSSRISYEGFENVS